MEKILIFGHKSPDTDSICSALAYAYLKTEIGASVEAVRLGPINDESRFVLDYFHSPEPRLIQAASGETSEVILVDHNEKQQSVTDRDDVTVREVIDHHRIANFETVSPVYYRAEPVGCTATILNKMFKEGSVAIPKHIAGLMLSAIVSDTLLLKSPTCTPEDTRAARELAEIAEVNMEEYGLKMLKAGADLSQTSVDELMSRDAKEFQMGENKVKIAQVNVIDTNDVLNRKKDILDLLNTQVENEQLDLFLMVVTHILDNNSIVLASGPQMQATERAFNVTLEDSQAQLNGVVSRKKQIVPALTKAMTT